MNLTKIDRLFDAIPDSQLDIRVSLSSGPNGLEIDFVMERIDEWGNSSHMVSGIVEHLEDALKIMTETLENRVTYHGLEPMNLPGGYNESRNL